MSNVRGFTSLEVEQMERRDCPSASPLPQQPLGNDLTNLETSLSNVSQDFLHRGLSWRGLVDLTASEINLAKVTHDVATLNSVNRQVYAQTLGKLEMDMTRFYLDAAFGNKTDAAAAATAERGDFQALIGLLAVSPVNPNLGSDLSTAANLLYQADQAVMNHDSVGLQSALSQLPGALNNAVSDAITPGTIFAGS
jgi:hypothetical protein